MSKLAEQRWTVEAFFEWEDRQEDRHELVNGFPMELMTGARRIHNAVAINILNRSGCAFAGRQADPSTRTTA